MADANPFPSHFRDAFVEATTVAFREVARTEVVLLASGHASKLPEVAEKSAFIDLTFPFGQGLMALNVSEEIVESLARRVMVGEVAVIDGNLADDCLGEIANVIAGQGKVLLSGTDRHYVFGTPLIVSGPERASHFDLYRDWLALAFQSDLGEIVVRVAFVSPA